MAGQHLHMDVLVAAHLRQLLAALRNRVRRAGSGDREAHFLKRLNVLVKRRAQLLTAGVGVLRAGRVDAVYLDHAALSRLVHRAAERRLRQRGTFLKVRHCRLAALREHHAHVFDGRQRFARLAVADEEGEIRLHQIGIALHFQVLIRQRQIRLRLAVRRDVVRIAKHEPAQRPAVARATVEHGNTVSALVFQHAGKLHGHHAVVLHLAIQRELHAVLLEEHHLLAPFKHQLALGAYRLHRQQARQNRQQKNFQRSFHDSVLPFFVLP